MICSNCGKEIKDVSKFCVFCGTPVSAPAENQNAVPTSAATPIVEQTASTAGSTVLLGAAENPTVNPASTASVSSTTVLGANNIAPVPPIQQIPNGTQPTAPAQLKNKKKKKKGKAGLIIILILLLLIIIAGCVFIFLWMNRPVNQIESAFSSGDLDKAIELFDEIENDADLAAVTDQALVYAEQVRDDYLNEVEGKDYATVSNILNKLYSGILSENADVADMIAEIDRINISRASFESAEKFKDAGRYADAITEYGKVIEEDTTYYQLAQASLTETIDIFRTDALDSAKAYENSGNYIAAKQVLDEALLVLNNDTSLISELNLIEAYIQDSVINDTLTIVNTAIAEGRYEDAFTSLNSALADFPDNVNLQNAKVSLQAAYKESKMAVLGEYYTNGDIDSALALLEQMKNYLPDDEQIPLLIAQYTDFIPTSLSSLTIYEYNDYYGDYTSGTTLTDTYENTYYDAFSLRLGDWSDQYGELVFLNNGKYDHISGILAYEYCSNTKGSGHIEIYADDILVYTSPTINDSTKPFSFEADLGDECHKLKIKWVTDGRDNTNLILANAQVYNR